jgi:hypothetical protein
MKPKSGTTYNIITHTVISNLKIISDYVGVNIKIRDEIHLETEEIIKTLIR